MLAVTRASRVSRLDGWTGSALLLMVLSLGLPWSSTTLTAGTYLPGYLQPSYCSTNYLYGTVDCTYSYYTPGMYFPGLVVGGAPGFQTSARVLVAGAFALLLLARRRASHQLAVGAVIAAAAAVVLAGRELRSGPLVLLVAIGCLVMAQRRTPELASASSLSRRR